MPHVLVTGGTGFLGARLVRALVRGDVTIGHTVYRALAGCDRLFHVAAEFKIWDRHPAKILDASIVGTRETLAAARGRGIDKIVVTSSTAAVGATQDASSMDEASPFNRETSAPYIVAKWKAEQIALGMARDFAMPIVVVNPATIMGPGDYKPTPSGDLLLTYLRWNLPFGVPCSAGGISIVDVDDVVKGHLLAMEKGRVGERYILGGDNVTIEQFFTTLSEITGLRGPGFKSPRALAMLAGAAGEAWSRITGKVPQLTYKLARDYVGSFVWVSSQKAKTELGYSQRPVRATLARAVLFFLENGYISEKRSKQIRFDLKALA